MKIKEILLYVLDIISIALIFTLDISVPVGTTPWLLYIFPVLGLYWKSNKVYSVILTSVISVLMLIDFFIVSQNMGDEKTWYFFGKILAISVFWIVTVLILRKHKSDKNLIESETKYSKTFEKVSIGIAFISEKGNWLNANERFLEITGFTFNELQNFTYHEINHPDDLALEMGYKQKLISGEINRYSIEKRLISKTGKTIWVNLNETLIENEETGEKYFVSVFEDISDKKRAEIELSETELRLYKAVVNSPFPLLVYAEDGEFIAVSKSWYDHSGYEKYEIPNLEAWLEKAYRENKVYVYDYVKKLFSITEKVYDGEFTIYSKSGARLIWEFSTVPLGKLKDGRRIILSQAVDLTERVKLRSSLEKNEQLFRSAFEQASVGIAHMTKDGKWIRFNKVFEKITGYEAKEILQMTYKDITHKDDIAKDIELKKKIFSGEIDQYEIEKRYIKKDGTICWVNISTNLLKEPGSQLTVLNSIIKDITKEKWAETQLESQKNKAEKISEISKRITEFPLEFNVIILEIVQLAAQYIPDAAVLRLVSEDVSELKYASAYHQNLDTKILLENVFANPEKIDFQKDKERFSRSNLFNGDENYFFNFYENNEHYFVSRKIQVIFEVPLKINNIVIGVIDFIKIESGNNFNENEKELAEEISARISPVLINSILHNQKLIEFQERIKAQQLLLESENKFKAMAESMPQIVWTANSEGDVDYYNQRWSEFSGIPQKDGEGWGWAPVLHKDDEQATIDAWKNSVETGEIYEIEHRIKSAKGEFRWYLSRGIPMKNDKGKIIKWFGTATDIHEQKLTQVHLRQTLDQLLLANKELEQFTYIASHDLQEPIRTINNFVQLFKKSMNENLSIRQKDFLKYIVESSSRIQDLITDLLKYSRINSSQFEIGNVDCNLVLSGVLNDLQFLIDKNNAVIKKENLPVIKGSFVQIHQLFINLIENAIKFRNSENPVIEIKSNETESEWIFSVKDNGIGIERKYFDKIFLIYQKLHDRDKYPGTGTGLAISKKIVSRHGGKIWVESVPGKGSTFYFTISKNIQ